MHLLCFSILPSSENIERLKILIESQIALRDFVTDIIPVRFYNSQLYITKYDHLTKPSDLFHSHLTLHCPESDLTIIDKYREANIRII